MIFSSTEKFPNELFDRELFFNDEVNIEEFFLKISTIAM